MPTHLPIIPPPRWQDIVDILIVAYVVYRIALLIRGTRTMQMVVGLMIVGIAFIASQLLGLFTLNWLLNNFLSSRCCHGAPHPSRAPGPCAADAGRSAWRRASRK